MGNKLTNTNNKYNNKLSELGVEQDYRKYQEKNINEKKEFRNLQIAKAINISRAEYKQTLNAQNDLMKCSKCFINDKNIVLLPCLHLSVCDICAKSLNIFKDVCPLCNIKINDIKSIIIK